MQIAGFQKLTLTDFPGLAASIVFTQGCNLKCPYCQNSELIDFYNPEEVTYLSQEDNFKQYIEKRKGILDGIVITGGEPTMQKDLTEFVKYLKNLGLKIKLDTNGTNPSILNSLISQGLLDYIAMDVKANIKKYEMVSGLIKNDYNITTRLDGKFEAGKIKIVDFNNKQNNHLVDNVLKSIEIIKSSSIDYEFRTTIVKTFHTIQDIKEIIGMIGEDSKYFLQNFEDSEFVLNHDLKSFSKEELIKMKDELNEYKNLKIRGIS